MKKDSLMENKFKKDEQHPYKIITCDFEIKKKSNKSSG